MKKERGITQNILYNLAHLLEPPEEAQSLEVLHSAHFIRTKFELSDGITTIVDKFPSHGTYSFCCFTRLPIGQTRIVRFLLEGSYTLLTCLSGGWLLNPSDPANHSFWIPQLPTVRTLDTHERIMIDQPAVIMELNAHPEKMIAAVKVPEGRHLDLVFWKIPGKLNSIINELTNVHVQENKPTFLWSSKTVCSSPADIYLYLIHGFVYQNARAFPRKWKFCCELDAYEIYVRLNGLHLATKKELYNLIRRQIVYSVVARQSADGGWYHGEWTDQKECHYRFHNGALMMLENALEEWPDPILSESLRRGAAFVASHNDRTNLGLWFLHDSLEDSSEAMDEMFRQTGPLRKGFGAWKASGFLGKSSTNKMILNTHIDTTVVLDRYREIANDNQFQEQTDSALCAIRAGLDLHPAETLYRIIFRAIGLTLLPESDAKRLPLPIRALKRLTWMYLTPRLYQVKHRFPRFVMPRGFIDRHISMLHFDAKYHAVNFLDLVRLWRRFPQEDLVGVVDAAIQFVMENNESILRWWGERQPSQFAIVVFAEGLYQLCLLNEDFELRSYLATVLMYLDDLRIGFPPSLFGGNGEILKTTEQTPCPLPTNPKLLIANLGKIKQRQILVINPTKKELELNWESDVDLHLFWTSSNGVSSNDRRSSVWVPPRGWVLGMDRGRGDV